jgi:myo-inositol-1(or 4)-monophosphatase
MGTEPSEREKDRLLAVAEDAVRLGGEVVARAAIRPRDRATVKGQGDYVTAVDRESEEAIRDLLASATPDIPVVAEEGGGEQSDAYWAVDPLDGTTNFLLEFPVSAVAAALVVDGRVEVGAVHAPLLGLTFVAARGRGAWSGHRRLQVSERPPQRAVVAMALPFRVRSLQPRYARMLDAVFAETEDIRRVGVAELDLAWTAAGVWDGYFELRLGVWDLAAGSLMVQEAGGIVTDWDGTDGFLGSGNVLAGSPRTHAVLLECSRLTADAG